MTKKKNEESFEEKFEELEDSIFSVEELQKMLNDKQIELNQALEENVKMKARTLKVHEENEMYKASPELAAQKAQFDFDMMLAKRFVDSGAFRVKNPEEAYIIMKAGAEMGLKQIESLQALCIVNGSIDYYGDGRSSQFLKHGYRIEYIDEKESEVTVRVHNTHMKGIIPDHEIVDVRETAKDKDQILQRSKAMGFAKKNKLRWHALGMIQSFHLPHLFTSVANFFNADFHEYQDQQKQLRSKNFEQQQDRDAQDRLREWIDNADTLEKLLQVKDDAKQFLLIDEWQEAASKFNTDAKK